MSQLASIYHFQKVHLIFYPVYAVIININLILVLKTKVRKMEENFVEMVDHNLRLISDHFKLESGKLLRNG